MLPGSMRVLASTRTKADGHASSLPLLAALGLALLGFLAVGLAGAGPATAANPTMPPFVPGRHVYDYGSILSAHSVTTAEALAAHIEAAGGGRVVLYTAAVSSDLPADTALAQAWSVDGLLLTGQGNDGQLTLGATVKSKLSSGQAKFINANSSSGQQTLESWMLSTLARVDAFVSGTHVFDGAGILDATGRQKAETAAKDLGSQLGATVYVDIALGGTDPSTASFVNSAAISDSFDTKTLVIALAVSDNQIGGSIDSTSDVWNSYQTSAPWKIDALANESAPNGDVQAALLAAIDAVQKPPLISSDAIPVIIFVVVVVLFSISAPFLWGPWLIRKLSGTTGPIKNGLPGDAIIESIADTGVTVSMAGVGPEAPDYKFGLQVTPAGGGAPYQVEVKALVPRIFIPMVVPGARVGVLIDPTDPMKVSIDFSRINQPPASAAGFGGYGGGGGTSGGVGVDFDASGQPQSGDVAALVGAIASGALPTIKGSADQLLATGTHGTAVITTAQPLGKTVRDINPSADPSRLNDPVWLFTLEVSLAGQTPFPAVFGHRVPLAKLASVAPGVKLAVAVGGTDPSHEVAIDWDKSPIV
jgi:hypothetical protein